jgi:hypothetical protein
MHRQILALALPALLATASNSCYAFVDSPGSPTPLRYAWSFDTSGTDAVFKFDCTNRNVCRFWCPRHEGPIAASVQVRDANNQFIGSSASQGTCTQQDIILP